MSSSRAIRRAAMRQLDANRANAQLSTGPRTEAGKAKVSLNAVKNALTGHTVLLPSDDAAVYTAFVQRHYDQHQPATPEEQALVQSIADTAWRLFRIPSLEAALFARGAVAFSEMFAEQPAADRPALIEAETLLQYSKEFKNLHMQEARLNRRRDKDVAELRRLQEERVTQENEARKNAAQPKRVSVSENGFEFSTAPIAASANAQVPAITPDKALSAAA